MKTKLEMLAEVADGDVYVIAAMLNTAAAMGNEWAASEVTSALEEGLIAVIEAHR